MIQWTQCMHRWLFWTSDKNTHFDVFHLSKLISRKIWIRMVQKLDYFTLWEGSRFNLADYWLSCSIHVGLNILSCTLEYRSYKINRTSNTVWKKQKFTLIWKTKIFRAIPSSIQHLLLLISRKFNWKFVRVNFAISTLWQAKNIEGF